MHDVCMRVRLGAYTGLPDNIMLLARLHEQQHIIILLLLLRSCARNFSNIYYATEKYQKP